MKGYGSKCADDYRGRKCIKDSSAKIVLYACDGTATELWTRHSNGEYVIRYNGQCLTEPSASNGS